MFFSTPHAPLFVLSAYAVGVLAVSAVSDATRDPSVANDLTQSGAGNYSIKPPYHSIHLDTGGTLKLSRGLATTGGPKPQFYFHGCDKHQGVMILDAIDASRKYIAVAENYLAQRGAEGRTYKRWFGSGRLDDVRKVITDLKSYSLVDYTADCLTCRDYRPFIDLKHQTKIITLCEGFWKFDPAGADMSQAIFIIAAVSMVPQYGDLRIIKRGWQDSEALALSSPWDAVKNLDNYVEFIVAANRLPFLQN